MNMVRKGKTGIGRLSKKTLSAVLSATLVLSSCMPAFAAENETAATEVVTEASVLKEVTEVGSNSTTTIFSNFSFLANSVFLSFHL